METEIKKTETKQCDTLSIKRSFISSFKDKNGIPIKEGDIIKEVLKEKKENYHYEDRCNMMGTFKPTRIIDNRYEISGWCIRQIKWSKDCLIAERLSDSGNVFTSGFIYLNSAFMGVNSSQDVEIIGNVYEGWTLMSYT
jgi:hypothetical protein